MIGKSPEGITYNEIISELNVNRKDAVLFSSYFSLDDLLNTNILLKRFEMKNNKIFLTNKGISYWNNLNRI